MTRAAIVVAISAGLFALLVAAIGAARGDACAQWQERYEEAAAAGGAGTLDFVNMGPLAELRRQRPHGCPVPD